MKATDSEALIGPCDLVTLQPISRAMKGKLRLNDAVTAMLRLHHMVWQSWLLSCMLLSLHDAFPGLFEYYLHTCTCKRDRERKKERKDRLQLCVFATQTLEYEIVCASLT